MIFLIVVGVLVSVFAVYRVISNPERSRTRRGGDSSDTGSSEMPPSHYHGWSLHDSNVDGSHSGGSDGDGSSDGGGGGSDGGSH
jgi:hypothetical protein